MDTPGAVSDLGNWQVLRTVIWRRLDQPSMELCRLSENESGFLLNGHVFSALQHVARNVRYQILCDRAWTTQRVNVTVQLGDDVETLDIRRESNGRWLRGDTELRALRDLHDIDLGFTPATNTLPIRRLAPDVGDVIAVTAVWVRFPDLAIEPLAQTYTRVGELTYQYESGGGRFHALIGVDDLGLVTAYERLFERLASS
jgi:hypothetical protein